MNLYRKEDIQLYVSILVLVCFPPHPIRCMDTPVSCSEPVSLTISIPLIIHLPNWSILCPHITYMFIVCHSLSSSAASGAAHHFFGFLYLQRIRKWVAVWLGGRTHSLPRLLTYLYTYPLESIGTVLGSFLWVWLPSIRVFQMIPVTRRFLKSFSGCGWIWCSCSPRR